MAEHSYIVVPDSFFSAIATHETEEAAIEHAAQAVDRDRKARLVVRVEHLVKPRTTPNVEVVRIGPPETSDVQP